MIPHHHIFCNKINDPVEGCTKCKECYNRYPYKEGETVWEMIERYGVEL